VAHQTQFCPLSQIGWPKYLRLLFVMNLHKNELGFMQKWVR